MSDVTGKAELLPDWPAQHCRNLQASVDSRPRNQMISTTPKGSTGCISDFPCRRMLGRSDTSLDFCGNSKDRGGPHLTFLQVQKAEKSPSNVRFQGAAARRH